MEPQATASSAAEQAPPAAPAPVVTPAGQSDLDSEASSLVDVAFINSLNFEEEDKPENISMDTNGRMKGASFAKLIALLTQPNLEDPGMTIDFLYTYRAFATSFDVMAALEKRFFDALKQDDAAKRKAIQLRVFNVIRVWLDRCAPDFRKDCPHLAVQTRAFFNKVLADNAGEAKLVNHMMVKLDKLQSSPVTAELGRGDSKIGLEKPPKSLIPSGKEYHLSDIEPEELARQIILMDWAIWENIRPWELIGLAWTKKDKKTRAPNVLAMIDQFNIISSFVSASICAEEKDKKRVKMISKWVNVAESLRKLGSLSGVMMIMSGLSNSAVHRLTGTFDDLSNSTKTLLQQCRDLSSRDRSFANARHFMRNINPPCVPYMGFYLTDLTFIEDGNKQYLEPHHLINFRKCTLLSGTIKTVQQYQNTPYNFLPVLAIQNMIRNAPRLTEDELYLMSEYLQPRAGRERGARPPTFERIKKALTIDVSSASSASSAAHSESSAVVEFELEFRRGYPFYPLDAPTNILLDDATGIVRAATLAKLIERLTHPTIPDSNSILPFLATYREFCKPHELMDLLNMRLHAPGLRASNNKPEIQQRYQQDFLVPVTLRCFNLLKTWVDRYWLDDFNADQQLQEKLQGILATPPNSSWTPMFTKALDGAHQRALHAQEELRTVLETLRASMKKAGAPTQSCVDFPVEEFAGHINVVSQLLFVNIAAAEALHSERLTQAGAIKPPSLARFTDFFENIKALINREFSLAQTVEARQALVEYLVRAADQLAQWNNMEAANTILSNVPETNVQDCGCYAHFGELKALVAKKTSATTNIQDMLAPPCVPTMSWFYTRVHADADKPSMLTGTMINFDKFRSQGECINILRQLQSATWSEKASLPSAYNDAIIALLAGNFEGGRRSSAQAASLDFRFSSDAAGGSGSVSGNNANNNDQLRLAMLGIFLHDNEVRAEIQSVVHEVVQVSKEQLRSRLFHPTIDLVQQASVANQQNAHINLDHPFESNNSSISLSSPPPSPAQAGIGATTTTTHPTVGTVVPDLLKQLGVAPAVEADETALAQLRATAQAALDQEMPDTMWGTATVPLHSRHPPGSSEPTPTVQIETIRRFQANGATAIYLSILKQAITLEDVKALLEVGKCYRMDNPTSPMNQYSLACILFTYSITQDAEFLAQQTKMKIMVFPKN